MCRVEMDVRLAVLYGSVAREDADATSDLDLLVSLSDDQTLATVSLARRLSATKGG
jgi:predicted nucleotidyltransferase